MTMNKRKRKFLSRLEVIERLKREIRRADRDYKKTVDTADREGYAGEAEGLAFAVGLLESR